MNFDLSIDDYNYDELIEMFGLPVNFDKIILENQINKLVNKINLDKSIKEKTKQLTIDFLNKSKNLILNRFKDPQTEIISIDNNSHIIQKQKNTAYVNSRPNEYFIGAINPLKKRTIIQNLNIDTRFRDNFHNSTSSNFNITTPIKINNILQMQLISIQLPNIYYTISSAYNNNYFSITINGININFSIPFGNYNPVTIMDAINANLMALGSPFSFVSFTADPNTLKTIIEPNGSGTITSLELTFYEPNDDNTCNPIIPQLTLGWLLGFRQSHYKDELNYISEGAIDLTGSKYFYLVVDDFNNNVNDNFVGAFKSSILQKNIIARITPNKEIEPIKVLFQNDFGLVSPPREYFGPINIQMLNIQLLDEYGRFVDLNNMDYNFCLSLITIYDL